ncbi:MAG TPA: ankyrin repeat domain-containing protein [Gammaproteobacteria bacterium]|nr:ankyrin repeat domain-containing protein [Gammaproteobacteria bacterium]
MEEFNATNELGVISASAVELEDIHEKLQTAFQAEDVDAVKACLKNHRDLNKLIRLYKEAVEAKYKNTGILCLCLMRMLNLDVREDVLAILEQHKPDEIKEVIKTVEYETRVKLESVPSKYVTIRSATKAFTREECVAFLALHGAAPLKDDYNLYGIRSNVGNIKFNAAAYKGDIKTLQKLLAEQKPGTKLVLQRLGGWTPLHCAALAGREETVRFLLANGASPATKNKKEKTALQLATDPAVQAVLRAAEQPEVELQSRQPLVPVAGVVGQFMLAPPQETAALPSSVVPSEIKRKNSK